MTATSSTCCSRGVNCYQRRRRTSSSSSSQSPFSPILDNTVEDIQGLREEEEEEEEGELKYFRVEVKMKNLLIPSLLLPPRFKILCASGLLVSIFILFTFFLSPMTNLNILKRELRGGASHFLPYEAHLSIFDEPTHNLVRAVPGVVSVSRRARTVSPGNDAEALKSLQVAVHLQKRHHLEKARKVFQHAVALSPNHPKVLNHFGEFLEETDQDLLEADGFYAKAILYSVPDSEDRVRALTNRHRTSLLVDEIDGRYLKVIDIKKAALQRIKENDSAFKRAKKEAYFQHVHHTVALEGNTMTLAQTRSILETNLAVGGKSIIEHNEILGLDAALKYINQSLVDRVSGEIRMQDILEIHRRVIGYSDPVEAGMFRRTQVFVGDHIPPSADQIEHLTERFVYWLNSPETVSSIHPVRLAALAHYKLVYIHPFVDGNGRTSRLLMNLILMQRGFPPVIVRKQDRLQYYQCLSEANDGDVRPFIRFIARSTERTLDAYLSATKENSLAVPFNTDDDHVLPAGKFASEAAALEYHEKVIMGGEVDIEP